MYFRSTGSFSPWLPFNLRFSRFVVPRSTNRACPAPVHEYREANLKKNYSRNASKEAGTAGKGGISTAQRSVKRGYGIAVMDLLEPELQLNNNN